MRTTIQIDDAVFKAFKVRAAERGTTLAHEIEEAMRADLASRAEAATIEPFRMPTSGAATLPGVDINSNAALIDLLDGFP